MHATFVSRVQLDGATATGIEVPADAVAALGAGRQPLVVVTLDGRHSYRSRVGVRGGVFKLPVSAANREAAGVTAGEEVVVTLELDTTPREVAVPAELAVALAAVPGARAAFDALSPSRRGAHVTSVESAKTAETRQRRLAKVVAEVTAA